MSARWSSSTRRRCAVPTDCLSSHFFSPDGQWVAYFAGGHLKKVPVGGGAPVTICDAQPPLGASWDGDRILFGQLAGIMEVQASGGTPKVLVAPDTKQGERLHGRQILPGGDELLFTVGSATSTADRWNTAQIVVQSLKTGRRRVLVRGGTDARYLPTGHIVYLRDGVLFANAFDLSQLELAGGASSVTEGVAAGFGAATGSGNSRYPLREQSRTSPPPPASRPQWSGGTGRGSTRRLLCRHTRTRRRAFRRTARASPFMPSIRTTTSGSGIRGAKRRPDSHSTKAQTTRRCGPGTANESRTSRPARGR
jgi:hypothetical protein